MSGGEGASGNPVRGKPPSYEHGPAREEMIVKIDLTSYCSRWSGGWGDSESKK